MDPSYNNFGSFGSSQPVASPGGGDIILGGEGMAPKKSKKGLIIGLGVLAVLILGIIIGAVVLFGNNSDKAVVAEQNAITFHELLDDNKDNIYSLLIFMEDAANGEIPMSSFFLSEEEYINSVEIISKGMGGLQLIDDKIKSRNFFLDGIEEMINLKENYEELKRALDRDLSKYERLADFTTVLLSIFQQKNTSSTVPDELTEFNLPELSNVISDFYKNGTFLPYSDQIIQEAYLEVGDGVIFGGEGSILTCLNNLYVGTDVYEQE